MRRNHNEKSNIGLIVFVLGIERIYGRSVCGIGSGGRAAGAESRRFKRNHGRLHMDAGQ